MLKLVKIAGLFAIAISTSACVVSDKASQNAVDENYRLYSQNKTVTDSTANPVLSDPNVVSKNETTKTAELVEATPPTYNVVDVRVVVPDYLIVSEANLYLPHADIVWREDPLGDRKVQVAKIVDNALRAGTAQIQGERPVIMSVRLNMFHALTEKARNSVGGKHNVQFDYVLLDAQTGQPVTKVKSVDASLPAYGGRKAYEAMRRGETQKVRITRHVANVIYTQLNKSAEI
ncbi:MAG: hypothetical protein GY947_13005 [Rhodobacteraceae bacterium]|nr:hypothetical protein [Paracoccaceae bacterium]